MGGAHGIAAQLIFEDVRIVALHRSGHGIAYIGVALVAVEAHQLQLPPVEVEAVGLPLGLAEADGGFHPVQNALAVQQLRRKSVQNGLLCAPGQGGGAAEGGLGVRAVYGKFSRRDPGPVPTGSHGLAQAQPLHRAGYVHRAVERPAEFRTREHICYVALLAHLQPDLAVQSAVGHVVDDEAEGRLIEALPAVQLYRDQRVPARRQRLRQLHGEGGVAAAVLRQLFPVDKDLGKVRRRADVKKYPFFAPLRGNMQHFPVAAEHLIDTFIEIVVGSGADGVRQFHDCPARRLAAGGKVFGIGFGKFPAPVQGDAFRHMLGLRLLFLLYYKANHGLWQGGSCAEITWRRRSFFRNR